MDSWQAVPGETGPLAASSDLENTGHKANLMWVVPPIQCHRPPLPHPPAPTSRDHLSVRPLAINSFLRLCFGENPNKEGLRCGQVLWYRQLHFGKRISEYLLWAQPLIWQVDAEFFRGSARSQSSVLTGDMRGGVSHQHARDQEHFLSAFGAGHVGCGQQIDVPNYIWLQLIISICLIPRARNAGGWWGRCQEACEVAEADNLGFYISMREKSGRVTAVGEG